MAARRWALEDFWWGRNIFLLLLWYSKYLVCCALGNNLRRRKRTPQTPTKRVNARKAREADSYLTESIAERGLQLFEKSKIKIGIIKYQMK